jgi:glycerophosphoryl diester phosphodiesterase
VPDAVGFATTVAHHVTVVATTPEILDAARENAPTVPRGYRVDPDEPVEDGLAVASDRDCGYLLLSRDACTERNVNTAHRAGMSVNAWPVRSREEAEQLADCGLDGILADRADVLPRQPH